MNKFNESILKLTEKLVALDVNDPIQRIEIVLFQGAIKGLINVRDKAAEEERTTQAEGRS